jgi:hypothetical protein
VLKKKTYWEYVAGGGSPETSNGSVFMHDETAFSHLIMQGLEFHLIILYICLFSLLDAWMNSSLRASLVIAAIDTLLVFARQYYGIRNISKTTFMDRKFML